MARFDVYENADAIGFLVDVQSDFLEGVHTRVVVPLIPLDRSPPIGAKLNPIFDIGETPHTLQPLMIAAVPRQALKSRVTTIASESDRVTTALDMLFQGF